MARSKRTVAPGAPAEVTLKIEGQTPAEIEEKTPGEKAAEETIDEVREASPKQATATIWRLNPDTGEKRWLANAASELISEAWLAKRFGGGKYRVQHKKPNANNVMVYDSQDTFDIDPAVRPEEPLSGAVMNADGSPAGAGSRMDSILETGVIGLMQQMQNQNQITLAFVEKMMTKDDTPKGPGVVEVIAAVAPLVAPLLELLKARRDPTDIALQVVEAMKPTAATPATSATDLVNMLKEGMQLAAKMNGGGGGDEASVLGVVSEGVKTLGSIVSGIIDERRRTATNQDRATGIHATGAGAGMDIGSSLTGAHSSANEGRSVAGAQLVGPGQTNGNEPGGIGASAEHGTMTFPNDRLWIRKARPMIPQLVMASKWMGADAAAATIERNLSDDEFEDLINDMYDESGGGFGVRLGTTFPAVASIPEAWFAELISTLVQYADIEEDDTTGDNKPVDTPSTAGAS